MNSKTKLAAIIMLLSGSLSFVLTYLYVNDLVEIASKTFRMISLPLLIIFIISLLRFLILTFKNSK